MPSKLQTPQNIIRVQRFWAEEDQEVQIQITASLVLMPIFRWDETCGKYLDATGDYDLCMNEEGTVYFFYSRRPGKRRYAYRFVGNYFPSSQLERNYKTSPGPNV